MVTRKYTPSEAEGTCLNCLSAFSYEHSTGTKKKHCTSECRVQWKMKRAAVRKASSPICSIDGCSGKATRVGAVMCEKHYGRVRRGVSLSDKVHSMRYKTKSGYTILFRPDHPIASGGRVAEHRVVAYDKHRGQCPECFWCGCELDWASAVVDHLDENKQNNDADNLAVSCNDCNRARGAMLPFVAGLTNAGLSEFFKRIVEYRAGLLCKPCHDSEAQRRDKAMV